MPIEFVSRSTDGEPGSGRRIRHPSRDPGLFWWTIVIIVLTGLVIFSWVFSIYVFSYPEKPFNYQLLTKLEKIDPIEEFPRLSVPGGRERTAKQIYATFYDYDATLSEVKNAGLKRSYLWNYSEESPIYVLGKYVVIESRALTSDDVFTSGLVVRAAAEDYPNAYLECIFPTTPGDAPTEHFRPGDVLTLEKNRSYASLLHLDWLNQDDLLITAVSLVYGRHRIDDTRFINQSAPTVLNLEGSWPIIKGEISNLPPPPATGNEPSPETDTDGEE